jgi:hypothetical protein
LPVTEYLAEDHEGLVAFGVVEDPTRDKGRELNKSAKRD